MPTVTPRRPPSTAAAPGPALRRPSAAVGALRTAQRRTSIVRIGVWAALASGPLALVVVCAMPGETVAAAQSKPAPPTAVRTTDPAGVAALFVDLWLRSDADQPEGSTAHAVQALAPDVDLPSGSAQASGSVVRTVAVRSAQLSPGTWSVIVAAQFTVRDHGEASGVKESGAQVRVRYYAVPVATADSDGVGAFTVTSAPARVAGPGSAQVPASPFKHPVPSTGALAVSVGEFLGAYLAGSGEVDRYLSPGTKLAAVRASGYRRVAVEAITADSDTAEGERVPGDGTRVRVEVHVTAKDAAGARWPLAYTLAMTARSGRWEVSALEAGAPPSSASPQPTGTSRSGGGAR